MQGGHEYWREYHDQQSFYIVQTRENVKLFSNYYRNDLKLLKTAAHFHSQLKMLNFGPSFAGACSGDLS